MHMVFNVAVSNRDDHTKNFSFLMDREGTWSLSPAYDLTFPFDPYQSFVIPHKISINQKTKDINRKDIVAVAKKVGIRNYNQIIDNVIEQVSTFETEIKQYALNKKTIRLIAKELEKNRVKLE